jgi:hypothetical protein
MPSFPFDVWGSVAATEQSRSVERIKVIRSPGGSGYLILTVESGSQYDTWVETIEEVEADLRTLSIEWRS